MIERRISKRSSRLNSEYPLSEQVRIHGICPRMLTRYKHLDRAEAVERRKRKGGRPVQKTRRIRQHRQKAQAEQAEHRFSEYAEANWPEKPAEFFSEAYEAWRKYPAEMKKQNKPLVDWFEKGGHLGPRVPTPPQR